jgi:hypothetical protein
MRKGETEMAQSVWPRWLSQYGQQVTVACVSIRSLDKSFVPGPERLHRVWSTSSPLLKRHRHLFPETQRHVYASDYLLPYSAEVKMSGATTPPPISLHDFAHEKYYFSLGVAECFVN